MEEMIGTLQRFGMTDDECSRIREQYRDDLDGLAVYVLIMRAMFDDENQYYE